jgi:transposase
MDILTKALSMYTDKQLRALDVVKAEIAARGHCTLSHKQVAQRAGVGRNTVYVALDKARLAGELVISRRQADGDTNVIRLLPKYSRLE